MFPTSLDTLKLVDIELKPVGTAGDKGLGKHRCRYYVDMCPLSRYSVDICLHSSYCTDIFRWFLAVFFIQSLTCIV